MGAVEVLCLLLRAYGYILLGRVIMSLVFLFKPDARPPDFLRKVIEVIFQLTEPPLDLIRRLIPQPGGFPMDLSFLVLYFLVGVILPRILGCGAGRF